MKKGTFIVILSSLAWVALDFFVPYRIVNIAAIAIASVLLVGLVLVAYGTIARNKWGINLHHLDCPACHSPVPKVRKPKSRREALWGGSTCDKCGCEFDKWGNRITS